jgi:ribosome biogenesis GTPase A
MKKTREMIEKHLSFVDVVCEVCDARIPVSSRNPVLDELTRGKIRFLILNKSDLADEGATKEWLSCLKDAVSVNSMSGSGIKKLMGLLEHIAAEKASSGTKKSGIPLRLMAIGIPNSGKSSLINRLAGKRQTQVGDKPGITRGKQWLTLENGMQLLDTPGILWPKIEDRKTGLHLAFCGSIRDEIMDISDLGLELIRVLMHEYPESLTRRYGIKYVVSNDETIGLSTRRFTYDDEAGALPVDSLKEAAGRVPSNRRVFKPVFSPEDALAVMEEIARKRGFILPGKRIDYERTARTVLDEFRSGKLGRITLEHPAGYSESREVIRP